MAAICLGLNSLKVKKMSCIFHGVYATQQNDDLDEGIVVNRHDIPQVNHTKFLGIIVDCSLNWKEHISYLCNTIVKNISVLTRGRKVFNQETMLSPLCNNISLPVILCSWRGIDI